MVLIIEIEKIRSNYPILENLINNNQLIYFDNAATMQISEYVLNKVQNHYFYKNSNIHRGVHYLSQESSKEYDSAKKYIANFIGAKDEESIIITSGTTESINSVARMIENISVNSGDEVLITEMEHHSNLIPWQELCKRSGAILKYIPIKEDGNLDMDKFYELFTDKTKIICFTEISNLTGIRNPVEKIIKYARNNGDVLILIDGAQGICNELIDVKNLDCDFYCFSGHKIGGPIGCGVLYMKEELIQKFQPIKYGGGIVHKTTMEKAYYFNSSRKFEAGTPNYIGAIGIKYAIEFMEKYNYGELLRYKDDLLVYLELKIKQIENLIVLGQSQNRKGSISFVVDGIHSYDISKFLDQYGIAIRSGHHCAEPYLNALGYEHACRVSPTFYNTFEEIDYFIDKLQYIIKVLRKGCKL